MPIKRKLDEGERETEEILKELEKSVAKEYKQAHDEIEAKYYEYLKDFETGVAKQKKLWEQGKITQKEYEDWVYRHIAMGARWEAMRDTLAEDYYNADVIAKSIISGAMPEVYALNYNYAAYRIMKDGNLTYSFTLYDHSTVERLLRDYPQLLPDPGKKIATAIAKGKALRWNRKQIQSSILQSILQGESMEKAAKRLERVTENNYNAALRNARTAITGAQNAGRQDSYKYAESIGVKLRERWIATLDGRTRHAHRQLHGVTVNVGEPFKIDGEKIRFPGDPLGEPYLVYNCRCTTEPLLKGFEGELVTSSPKMGNMTYEEWKKGGKGWRAKSQSNPTSKK